MDAALQAGEQPPELRIELERVLADMRQGRAAGLAQLRALHERAPDDLEVIGHLAWALAHHAQYEESIRLYRRFLQIQPENFEVQWRIADRLINLGRIEEALATYQAVLERHPQCEDAAVGARYAKYLLGHKTGGDSDDPPRREWTARQRSNAELNRKEFAARKLRLRSLPPSLYLESTTKCNFYCKTCSKGYDPYYAEDLAESILEQVRREVMPTNVRISITGFGEPTMAGNFNEILRMAVDNGSTTHFVTNGSLLNFSRIERLTRTPVDIIFSIDGATKETFEAIRSGSNFDQILDKLAMVKRLREIYLSSAYANFSFNFVALRQNIHELPDVIRLAHRYGIRHVGVADYAFNDNEFDRSSLRFEHEKANHFFAEARRVAEQLDVTLQMPPPYQGESAAEQPRRTAAARAPAPEPRGTKETWQEHPAPAKRRPRGLFSAPDRFPQQCSSPWSEPYIHTDGRVTPCCASGQDLGELRRNSFAEIWNGWRYRLLRWRIHSPVPPLACRNCFVSFGINGGNAGNAIDKEGLLVKVFYGCEIRLRRCGKILKHRLARLFARRTKHAPVQPNFHRGRKISAIARQKLRQQSRSNEVS